MIYTPYDIEQVMQQPEEQQALKEVTLDNGIVLLGQQVTDGFKIERVISGNGNAYLLTEYQPGSVLRLP